MATIIHLIGVNGSGKSMHAVIMSKHYAAQGLKCAGVDDPMTEFIKDEAAALKEWPDADVIFLEHLPEDTFITKPGDQIIHLSRAN